MGLARVRWLPTGVAEQAINAETRAAMIKLRAGMRELAIEAEDL